MCQLLYRRDCLSLFTPVRDPLQKVSQVEYFKWTGENFAKQVIDYGPIRQAKGCGIFFQVVDIDGDGRLDIVAPGKDGLYLFKNVGDAKNMGD